MKKLLWIAFVLAASAAPAEAAQSLHAHFIDAKGAAIGAALLRPMANGTLITVDLHLPPGVHAIHIHEHAGCDAPDFKTAGGHFNPEGRKHGFNNEDGFHAGDLPNLFVEPTGHIKADIFSAHLHLSGKDGLDRGAAIVVHAGADDYGSDPAGNAGARIACAVIEP